MVALSPTEVSIICQRRVKSAVLIPLVELENFDVSWSVTANLCFMKYFDLVGGNYTSSISQYTSSISQYITV